MNILALSLLSVGLYGFGTIHQLLIYLRRLPSRPFISFVLGATAVCLQVLTTLELTLEKDHFNFSVANTLSLSASLVIICLLILALRRPLQSIFLAAYPAAILSLVAMLAFDDSHYAFSPEESGVMLHIALSILAYSIFCIAGIQAILIHLQNNNLKKRRHAILQRNLPPLLTMENLLFEMLWSGTLILLLAIVIGFAFVEDLFAQHLAHKTFFSLAALALFSTLLVGRLRYGWRGMLASHMTLWGVALLMLGFVGSKFVLQWLMSSNT